MIDSTVGNNDRKMRKLIVQLASGGLVGGLFGYFGMEQLDSANMAPDQIVTSGIGIIYLLTGLIVGFGLLSPNLGSKILNVEDADEIREQRRVLTGSTISMTAIGVALVLMANTHSGGLVTPATGFAAICISLFLATIITIRDWKYYDELMRQLSRDCGNLAFGITGTIVVLWSAAAAAGWVVPFSSLALIALFFGNLLLAAFVATARAGLMMPR